MIDLIDESAEDLERYGYKTEKYDRYGLICSHLSINNKKEVEETGFDKGDYYIFNCPLIFDLDNECWDYYTSKIYDKFKNMVKKSKINKNDKVLIVGLGNPDIMADSLGNRVSSKVEIKAYKKENRVLKICPNIFSNTGINAYDIIRILIEVFDISAVFLIDSLTTSNINRFGTSIQINSAGLTPGSAMNNFGKKISKETLGVPCFSIGVPLMMIAKDLCEDSPDSLVIAPKDIDENLDTLSYIISNVINKILK